MNAITGDSPFAQPRGRFGFRLGIIAFVFLFSLSLPTVSRAESRDASTSALTYTVTQDTPNLSATALFLYGKARMFREIARWNGIAPPYLIHPGQILVLKKSPTLSPEEGSRRLLAFWRKKFGLAEPEAVSETASNTAPDVVTKTVPEAATENVKTDEAAAAELEQEKTPDEREAETSLETGEARMQAGDCPAALASFRATLTREPENLAAALDKYHCFKLLHRDTEARESAQAILREHPELRDLPVFARISKEAGS